MSEKFKCEYEVDDGYAGRSRPKYFNINEYEIGDDMDKDDLKWLFETEMQNDFEQNIYPYEKNQEEFVEWALDKIKQNKTE